jgi:hypothetical protein
MWIALEKKKIADFRKIFVEFQQLTVKLAANLLILLQKLF